MVADLIEVSMQMQVEISTAEALSKPSKQKRSGPGKPPTGSEKVAGSHACHEQLVSDAELGPRPQPMPVSFILDALCGRASQTLTFTVLPVHLMGITVLQLSSWHITMRAMQDVCNKLTSLNPFA